MLNEPQKITKLFGSLVLFFALVFTLPLNASQTAQPNKNNIRPLSKLAELSQVVLKDGAQNRSVHQVHEDSSTIFRDKLTNSVEFRKRSIVKVDVFLSSSCPHCAKAKVFFSELQSELPWVKVKLYIINENKDDLKSFYQQLLKQPTRNFAVPAFFFCDSRWVGFDDKENSGKLLKNALNFCYKNMNSDGSVSQATKETLQTMGAASQYVVASEVRGNAFNFLPYAALIDAFSMCSLFLFLLFIAGYWIYSKQLGKQFIFGLAYIGILGGIHFAHQVDLLNYYQIKMWLRYPAALIGLLLVLVSLRALLRIKKNVHYSSLILLLLLPTIALVYSYQQTCQLDIAIVFEEWMKKNVPELAHSLVLYLLYQLIFLLPMIVLFVLCLLLSLYFRAKPVNKGYTAVALIIIFILGMFLLISPALLSKLGLSIGVIIIASMLGWILKKHIEY